VKSGILAGAFNPVTRAHVALADAARAVVDEIVCVLPRAYPHKELHGASLDQRIEMLGSLNSFDRIQVTEGGLFIDIARELRRSQPDSELFFICGRDAAERVLTWDYDQPGVVDRMLEEFQLLVASRQGRFDAPLHLRERVHALVVGADLDDVSSTEVRRRIAAGESWEHLVPGAITDLVRGLYSSNPRG
jgi:nicotinate-nucleotide adenylyltransferase